jgi:hypothetical protein
MTSGRGEPARPSIFLTPEERRRRGDGDGGANGVSSYLRKRRRNRKRSAFGKKATPRQLVIRETGIPSHANSSDFLPEHSTFWRTRVFPSRELDACTIKKCRRTVNDRWTVGSASWLYELTTKKILTTCPLCLARNEHYFNI